MPRSVTRHQGGKAHLVAREVDSPTRSTTPRREETTQAADTTNGRSKAKEPQEGNHQGGKDTMEKAPGSWKALERPEAEAKKTQGMTKTRKEPSSLTP